MDQFLQPKKQYEHLERLFKESTLSFCIGIKNILYTKLVPFLVNEIFTRLMLASELDNKNGDVKISDDSDEANSEEDDNTSHGS